MISDDRRIKVREIVEAVKMSKERFCHRLHQDLDMTKLPASWLPRWLTSDQTRVRMHIFNALFGRSLGTINPSFGID